MSAASEYEEFALINMQVERKLLPRVCILIEPMLNRWLMEEYEELTHVDLYVEDNLTCIKIHLCSFKYAMKNGAKISQSAKHHLDDIITRAAAVAANEANRN